MKNEKKRDKFALDKAGRWKLFAVFALVVAIIGILFLYTAYTDKPNEKHSLLEGDRTQEKYQQLKSENPDFYGWLLIDDTSIDYPVVFRDNAFYLNHNFRLEEDPYGTPFIDERCNPETGCTNMIIYGHSTLTGPVDKMFDQLLKYRDESFYAGHHTIHLDTEKEDGLYEIVMVIESRIMYEDEADYRYYNFIQAENEQEFNEHMEELQKLQLYDTGVTASYGDQLITLSTCDYERENGRLAVIAKKIE